jgi:hypothetical protein
MFYGDDVNIVGGCVHNIKENGECLEVASKQLELEIYADKPKCMTVSGQRNEERS